MSERKLTIIIGGDAKAGVKALEDTGKAAGGVGSKIGTMAKVGVAGLVAVGGAAVAFGVKSASTFARVGGEVNKLIRYTGATAEEASRLRFAGAQAGLGVDVMTKSLGLLSKGLAGTKFDKLDLDLKNADGSAKPLNQSLLVIATRFQSMENGPAKTALAMQLFGKAGADMIPFLNRGAAGIAELERQSDKYGNTLSGKDLQAVKDSTANHRLFASAMEGLQIQVGRYVLPIMTKFTSFLATNMPQAIEFVRKVMEKLAPTFDAVSKVLDTAFTKGAQVIRNDLVPALSIVGGWLNDNKPVLEAIATIIGTTLVVALVRWGVESTIAAGKAIAGFVASQAQAIASIAVQLVNFGLLIAGYIAIGVQAALTGAEMAAAWLIGLGPIALVVAGVAAAAALIVTHWDTIVNAAKAVWNWISDHWKLLFEILTGPFGLAVVFISDHFTQIVGFVTGIPGRIAGAASTMFNSVKDAAVSAKNWVGDRLSDVVGFFTGMPGRISRVASGMFDGIKNAFRSAINWIIRAWNRLEFKIPGFDPPGPGPKFGGFTLGVPNIPELATGGIVRQTSGGLLALLGEGGSNEAVIPLNPTGMKPLIDGLQQAMKPVVAGQASAATDSAAFLRTLATGFTAAGRAKDAPDDSGATADEQRALDLRRARGIASISDLASQASAAGGLNAQAQRYNAQLAEFDRIQRDGTAGLLEGIKSAFGIDVGSGGIASAVADGVSSALAPQQDQVADLLRQILTALSNPAPLMMDGVKIGEVVLANLAARRTRNGLAALGV